MKLKSTLLLAIAILCIELGGVGSTFPFATGEARVSPIAARAAPTLDNKPSSGAEHGSAVSPAVAWAAHLFDRAGAVVLALPDAFRTLARVPREIAHSSPGRSPGMYWLLLGF